MNFKIWLASDPHLGHNKDFMFGPRGFESIEEHNKAIVENWNSVVYPDDEVYVLGDLTLGDVEEGMRLIAKLNGHLHIIRGNHDTDTKVERYKAIFEINCFIEGKKYTGEEYKEK